MDYGLPHHLAAKIVEGGCAPAHRPDLGVCWIWTATRCAEGYGRVWHDGSTQQAHRVVYEILVAPIPEGLTLDHLCLVKSCVRPSHVEPVPFVINAWRAFGYVDAPAERESADDPRGAHWALRTRCKHGHELTDDNVYEHVNRRGYSVRSCRTCKRAARRRRRQRLTAAGTARHG